MSLRRREIASGALQEIFNQSEILSRSESSHIFGRGNFADTSNIFSSGKEKLVWLGSAIRQASWSRAGHKRTLASLLHFNSPSTAAAMDTRTLVALNIGSVISLPSFFVCNSASNGSN